MNEAIEILLVAAVIQFFVMAINYGTLWKIALVIAAAGIPFHELGHLVPIVLFRVPVYEVHLLEVWTEYTPHGNFVGAGGHVRGDYSKIPHACAALLIGFGPFIAAFVWVQGVYELGNWAIVAYNLDPNWIMLFFIIIVGIGFSCTPSRADLHVTGTFLLAHLGQTAITILMILVGCVILYLAGWPFDYWWQTLLAIVVLFLPSWVACKVYVYFLP
jgi:hypothetical protein